MSKKEDKKQELDAAKLLQLLTDAQYLDRKTLYLHTFVKGVIAGAGTVLGATVLIAVIIWLLSLFDTVPLIGPFIDSTRQTIEQR